MRILYDHQIFSYQNYGGISRYFANIIANLPKGVKADISIKFTNNEYVKKLKLVNDIEEPYKAIDKFITKKNFKGKASLFKVAKKLYPGKFIDSITCNRNYSIEIIKQQQFDVFHPTYYDDYFLEYLGEKPFVVTVHDMIHELYPEMFNDTQLAVRKARLIKSAAHIIAVSENTKRDIMNILDVPDSRISVIYHANALERVNGTHQENPGKYFLYVGGRSNYKNFMFFASAIQPILENSQNLSVICTGRGFNTRETDYLKSLGVYNRFISISTDDKELAILYSNAIALVFPSYYEGFGIPILEAFEMGCPVLLSNIGSLKEVAGDAAIYFDPKNMVSLRSAIINILNNHALRDSVKFKGYEKIKEFSWEKSALETARIYQEIIKYLRFSTNCTYNS